MADEEKLCGIAPKPPQITIGVESTPLFNLPAAVLGTPYHRRSLALIAIGVIELAFRTTVLVHACLKVIKRDWNAQSLDIPIAFLVTWLCASIYPLIHPPVTAQYPLSVLYLLSLLSSLAALYNISVNSFVDDFPFNGKVALLLLTIDAALAFIGLSIVVGMPMEENDEPKPDSDGTLPAPDDHVTLWQWVTSTWVSPIIVIGMQGAISNAFGHLF